MSGYIFLDKLKKMTDDLEEDYAKTLQIKKEIFRITQPKSPTYSDVKIQNDNIRDKFGEYVELIEAMQIEKRLYLLEKSINDCKHIIRRKEEELRNSKDYDDKIYCLWFLDGKSVKQIGDIICYQKTAVYEAIKRVKNNLSISPENSGK